MSRNTTTYNTDGLSSVHAESLRCARAIDELEWAGQFEKSDIAREELRYLDTLHAKGDVYVPDF